MAHGFLKNFRRLNVFKIFAQFLGGIKVYERDLKENVLKTFSTQEIAKKI